MFHRITVKPWTKINEAWNYNDQLDSSVKESYRDSLVGGQSNIHQVDKNIYSYQKDTLSSVGEYFHKDLIFQLFLLDWQM